MSYFQTQDQSFEQQTYEQDAVPEEQAAPDEQEEQAQLRSPGARLADFRERIARAVSGFERGHIDQLALEPGQEPPDGVLESEPSEPEATGRFPVGRFGYNRGAVDEYIAELEREIAGLRSELPGAMTINEEIERIGEQTASILVVAHDQAKETTRRAQEQADRCVADAASNAVTMTEQAKQRLLELDGETDAVWQERMRLLEDARTTGGALIALAEEAAERFPEETKSMDTLRG
jgi:hypothetical protein